MLSLSKAVEHGFHSGGSQKVAHQAEAQQVRGPEKVGRELETGELGHSSVAVAVVELAAVPVEQSAKANGIDQNSEARHDLAIGSNRKNQKETPSKRIKNPMMAHGDPMETPCGDPPVKSGKWKKTLLKT